eukprot:SAG25_NODE_21_length_22373_cov_13.904373_30_plen_43_part_00
MVALAPTSAAGLAAGVKYRVQVSRSGPASSAAQFQDKDRRSD